MTKTELYIVFPVLILLIVALILSRSYAVHHRKSGLNRDERGKKAGLFSTGKDPDDSYMKRLYGNLFFVAIVMTVFLVFKSWLD